MFYPISALALYIAFSILEFRSPRFHAEASENENEVRKKLLRRRSFEMVEEKRSKEKILGLETAFGQHSEVKSERRSGGIFFSFIYVVKRNFITREGRRATQEYLLLTSKETTLFRPLFRRPQMWRFPSLRGRKYGVFGGKVETGVLAPHRSSSMVHR